MRVFWDNDDKTILIREFPKELVWQDYERSLIKMRHMLQEVEHEVYIIIDTRQVEIVPKEALHHLQAANRNLPSSVQMRCLVYNSERVYNLYAMLVKISPQDFNNFYFVTTIEDAYKKISDAQSQMP